MEIFYNAFGQRRIVRATVYRNGRVVPAATSYDTTLYAERAEDLYALGAPALRWLAIAVVTRTDWLAGKQVEGTTI